MEQKVHSSIAHRSAALSAAQLAVELLHLSQGCSKLLARGITFDAYFVLVLRLASFLHVMKDDVHIGHSMVLHYGHHASISSGESQQLPPNLWLAYKLCSQAARDGKFRLCKLVAYNTGGVQRGVREVWWKLPQRSNVGELIP